MRIYSFDIFDTCLGRICGNPKNIFDIIAVKVLGDEASSSLISDFRLARVRGETAAREKSESGEVTLDDIYQSSDFSALTSSSKDTIKILELETEEENLFGINTVLQRVDKIHNNGGQVIYISDMYLPSSFLQRVLEREGFWKDGDKVYVSCEYNATKSSGKLFELVKQKERLQYRHWSHQGDNFGSDFLTPLKKGIYSKRFACDYSKYEKLVLEKALFSKTRSGSILPGISRSIISGELYNERVAFCADIIAPIYVPFVYNTLQDAQKRGIRRLYFLARDGYIFFKIAEVFKNSFPDIECYYLYASRKSLYLPSVEDIDETVLSSLLMKDRSIEECVDTLQIELNEEEIKHVISSSTIERGLIESPTIREKIVNQWKSQRDLCVQYFVQEGLASEDGASAIIDLRGTRKSQMSINKILKNAGYPPVYAYYLEVTKDRIVSSDGYCSQFFSDNIVNLPSFRGLVDGKYILEHYFSITPFQRTSHYALSGSQVKPVFDNKEIVHPEASAICDINIRCCVDYAHKLLMTHQEKESRAIVEYGLAVFSSFILKPDREYLIALLNVNTSQTQFKTRKLIGRVGVKSLLNKSYSWYEGSFMYTYGILGLWFYKKILSKCVRVFLRK